ncbi:MAG: hypothetical protein ACRYFS_14800 [Janthinobacterium lividum]
MQQPEDKLTGEEIVQQMDPKTLTHAQEELDQVEPGGSEPFRIGDEGMGTELDENPISESGSSRQSRP